MYSSRGSNVFGQQSYAAQLAAYGASATEQRLQEKREDAAHLLSLMISGMLLRLMLLLVG